MNLNIEMNPTEVYEQDSILEYKKALNAACEQLKRLKNEKDNLQDIHEEFKQHYEKLKRECSEISRRHMETIAEKKHLEAEYESQLKHLRGLLEQREKILDEQRSKALLPTDTDMLRAKIAREIEAPYRQRVDNLTQEIDRIETELSEARRANILLKSEMEANNMNHNKYVADLKQKYQGQISDLMSEVQVLNEHLDDTNDKELLRTIKREAEEYKRKALEIQRELGELRRQRDDLKLEKNTVSIDHAKQIEQMKMRERKALNDLEDQQLELQKIKEELKSEMRTVNEMREQIQQLTMNNKSLKEKLHEAELNSNQYLTQFQTLDEELKERENALEAYARSLQDNQKDKTLYEREEKARLQKEVERLEKELLQCKEKKMAEYHELSSKYEAVAREKNILQEDYKMARKRLTDLQSSFEGVKQNYMKTLDARDKLEKEVGRGQEKYRSLLNKEHELTTDKAHLEFSIKVVEGNFRKLEDEKRSWELERGQLQRQIAELSQRLEQETKRTQEELLVYKRKASDYKGKVREANIKLQQMATKLSRLQVESFAPAPEILVKPTALEPLNAVTDIKQLETEIAQTLHRHKGIA